MPQRFVSDKSTQQNRFVMIPPFDERGTLPPGIHKAYVDGSFASSEEAPNDFDACWEPDGVDLNALNPALLDFSEDPFTQKWRFRGEFFPADMLAEPAGLSILDFFQRDRASRPKGIVEIDLETGL